jgi:hypothetical protein
MSDFKDKLVRVVNEDVIGHKTKILMPDGAEIEGVYKVELSIPVDGLVEATLHMYSTVDTVARVKEIKETFLPPPLPKTQYRLTVDAPEQLDTSGDEPSPKVSKYRLERITPLPTYGVKEEELWAGVMGPVGPLELVCDAPDA